MRLIFQDIGLHFKLSFILCVLRQRISRHTDDITALNFYYFIFAAISLLLLLKRLRYLWFSAPSLPFSISTLAFAWQLLYRGWWYYYRPYASLSWYWITEDDIFSLPRRQISFDDDCSEVNDEECLLMAYWPPHFDFLEFPFQPASGHWYSLSFAHGVTAFLAVGCHRYPIDELDGALILLVDKSFRHDFHFTQIEAAYFCWPFPPKANLSSPFSAAVDFMHSKAQ